MKKEASAVCQEANARYCFTVGKCHQDSREVIPLSSYPDGGGE